jgi:hypothetical protein
MDQDVFINAVGGVRIGEPAADMAVMLAITSSLRGKPLPKGFIAFGEVGLAGEVRPAPRGQERLREAAKLGFTMAIVPKANAPKKPVQGMTILSGLKPEGSEWAGGEVLDPASGKVYRARIKLADAGRKLEMRGYVGVPTLGRTQVWLREP